jgi:hypothetical protein
MSQMTAVQARKPEQSAQESAGGVLQRKRDKCRKKKPLLQRSAIISAPETVPPIVHAVLRSPGTPLDSATRSFMEPRFGRDFSHVRIHTDAKAAESARAVDALAYTVDGGVVFGKGKHAPGTSSGRRLLAHELAHVVQQSQSGVVGVKESSLEVASPLDPAEREAKGAASRIASGEADLLAGAGLRQIHPGTLQRTPAPPSYGGVTGVRDPSKIRIDAVADFVPNMFALINLVNVHVTDPDVTHITWMLYDPGDRMIDGFSTMPGSPASTTKPFILKYTHFSGAGFVEGKYLLRCAGLNTSNQPVIYADRDFNVLTADLTTGTALPTAYGDLTFTKYDKTDANPPANPRYSIDAELKFLPKNTVQCNDVTFIQSVQSIDNQGRSLQHTANPETDARKTPLAWSIDRIAGAPSPFYIAGRDQNTGNIVDVPGWGTAGRGGRTPRPATLIDTPGWSQINNAKFESCVICRSGNNRGEVYGCATWGYTANSQGQVTLMPRGFRQMPSDQFEEARASWNAWRATIPAARRPEEAPALSKP